MAVKVDGPFSDDLEEKDAEEAGDKDVPEAGDVIKNDGDVV